MHVCLVTPAPPRSRAGNRATATRWARFLRARGHRVRIRTMYEGETCDVLIALHAWRSAEAVRRYRERRPQGPLVVAMTGTDLYRFIHSHPDKTLRSMDLADRLVVLHEAAQRDIPAHLHDRVRAVLQSAEPVPRRLPPAQRTFDVCVVGHLREEKDPLRTAWAVRELPHTSRIRVLHYGRAHDESWAQAARAEAARNPRYRWLGEVPHWRVRRAYARCRLMVLSSRMEGGANVVSEAVSAGLPVIASDIPGSVGLLGTDYPGYYPLEDTAALREMLLRAEGEPAFLAELARRGEARAPLFRPEREAAAIAAVVEELA